MKVENIPANIKSKSLKEAKEEINEILTKLEKQDVNGKNRSPLYQALIGDGPDIKWNF